MLDTYQSERHPIAAGVLDWTRAQVALMRGDEQTGQLRAVMADQLLTVPGVMNRLVALTAGILQRYDVAEDADVPVGTIVGGLFDHGHDGGFVLVDRTAEGSLSTVKPRFVYAHEPRTGEPSILVRPDGVIIWAAISDDEDTRARLDRALARWAGSGADAERRTAVSFPA
ncbi:hypothetical protein [Actinoplanes sp. NPDC051851]|uniref:aromatic-ring hydroxylase C-terminal domain-containing protein n=1 Tax=Actinoplanes sp. NPDC051851 TaxID=3154753 RepID=UPI003436D88F